MTPLEAAATTRRLRLAGQSACYEAGIRRAIVALEFGNIAAALTQLRAALLVAEILDGKCEEVG
jgi:hypothetical protein